MPYPGALGCSPEVGRDQQGRERARWPLLKRSLALHGHSQPLATRSLRCCVACSLDLPSGPSVTFRGWWKPFRGRALSPNFSKQLLKQSIA